MIFSDVTVPCVFHYFALTDVAADKWRISVIFLISHPTTDDLGFLQECCQAAINVVFMFVSASYDLC